MLKYIGLIAALTFLATAGAFASAGANGSAQTADQILFRFSGEGLFDGAFGPLNTVELAGEETLKKCNSRSALDASGYMNLSAQRAFKALSACPDVSPKLSPDSEARQGAVTAQLWAILVGGPVPDAAARARTMMLTFEATDYTALEWNFCQSRPKYDPLKQPICFSNDPKSFITWGPNGATAGGGREVQAILSQLEATKPQLIRAAFGGETDAVRRLLLLRSTSTDTEIFLCGIWANPARRAAWKAGFAALGTDASVRDTYDRVYRSTTFDGGKIDAFVRAYRANGLIPSEVDFAFFKDRAAHMGINYNAVESAVAAITVPSIEHWKVRREIALRVRPSNQREDRLGRDVAFYVDGIGVGRLSAEEASAWASRGSRRVSDVGLSDAQPSMFGNPEPPINETVYDPVALTIDERAACPVAVLQSRRPNL